MKDETDHRDPTVRDLRLRDARLLRRRVRRPRASSWDREAPPDNGEDTAPDAASRTVTIASYNIHKAVGRDRRFDPARIVEVIRELDADVVALQEADQRFGERTGLLDLALLEARTGLHAVRVGIGRGHGWRGNVVLLRNGAATACRHLVLPGVEPRGALIVDLDLGDVPLRVVAAHLGLLRHSRSRQVGALVAAARADDGRAVVMMGDFNEWRLGRRSSLQGLAPEFGPLHAAIPSFPARFPLLALDRIVAYPPQAILRVALHDTPLARVASDHLPLTALVRLPLPKPNADAG